MQIKFTPKEEPEMKKSNITVLLLFQLAVFFINSTIAMESHTSLMLSSLDDEYRYSLPLHGVNTIQSLEDNIKTSLELRKSCTYFNTFLSLKKVGRSFYYYKQEEKNSTLRKLLKGMHDFNYWNKRSAALMLIHAGADNNAVCRSYPLLERAIHRNDIEAIIILFENKADANQTCLTGPNFFSIKDIAIAKEFIAQGVNINAQHLPLYPNVLWNNICHSHSVELFEFYLNCGVDGEKIRSCDGYSLLHLLIEKINQCDSNGNYITIAKLLHTTFPDMVNILDKRGRTPFDLAEKPGCIELLKKISL